MTKTYKYGMRLRGFSPGAQPMEGLLYAEDGSDKVSVYGRMYPNILVYNRRLSEQELRDYELDYLGGNHE